MENQTQPVKYCWHCKSTKPLSEFGKDKHGRGGKRNVCSVCARWMSFRTQAKQRHGTRPNLTYAEWLELRAVPNCACCGKLMRPGSGPDPDQPTIDRIDNGLPYTVENCATICWGCNDLKGENTPETLRMLIDYVERATMAADASVAPGDVPSGAGPGVDLVASGAAAAA